MLYVLHALDRSDGIENRAKHYREHRAHLDRAASEGVEIVRRSWSQATARRRSAA